MSKFSQVLKAILETVQIDPSIQQEIIQKLLDLSVKLQIEEIASKHFPDALEAGVFFGIVNGLLIKKQIKEAETLFHENIPLPTIDEAILQVNMQIVCEILAELKTSNLLSPDALSLLKERIKVI
jgi:hypothetical protein